MILSINFEPNSISSNEMLEPRGFGDLTSVQMTGSRISGTGEWNGLLIRPTIPVRVDYLAGIHTRVYRGCT